MLKLKGITKNYTANGSDVQALKGVDMEFGKNEFVSILGPSGCGKTTLLNIIGGLDRYTDGDLVIRNKSTKDFGDRDWDNYRNHTIGFVFQSYNLIPHQTVLANVELALTLSGVKKSERRRKAEEALKKVGLGDQIKKKPNQLSGGQMQRVAIARAIVNNPDVILADEPTGALDTETSIQVLNILKEISKSKLVIMVTHNPELAEKYSTRIIKLLDGAVISDESKADAPAVRQADPIKDKASRLPTMSFFTAISLSFKNLLTKKGRTVLTAFAGSIGIIGIALILSLSSGINAYINRVQEDTLSSYPLQITQKSVDTSMLETMTGKGESGNEHPKDAVYSNTVLAKTVNTMLSTVRKNDLKSFKNFLESKDNGLEKYVSSYKFAYNITPNIFTEYTDKNGEKKIIKVNPSDVMKQIYGDIGSTMTDMYSSFSISTDFWTEMIDDKGLLSEQYDVIAGRWPEAYNEVVLVVNKNNEISDLVMYALGIKDPSEMKSIMQDAMLGNPVEIEEIVLQYSDVLNMSFKLIPNNEFFVKNPAASYDPNFPVWKDCSEDEKVINAMYNSDKAINLHIVGILRPDENASSTSVAGAVGYTSALTDYLINKVNNSEIAKQQLANPNRNVLNGMEFSDKKSYTLEEVKAFISMLPEDKRTELESMSSMLTEEQLVAYFNKTMVSAETFDTVCESIGIVDIETPSLINIYARTFNDKDEIKKIISAYNQEHEEDGKSIHYSDLAGLVMSAVTTITNFVVYALIAFVSISLVVSSLMIGIITYTSVLERIKEIGLLRAIGASKRDITRVFNAETLIIGFSSGIVGILLTLLLILPLNLIIKSLSDISNIASLPLDGALILIAISMILTILAGFIPARIASKKDPVTALRSE